MVHRGNSGERDVAQVVSKGSYQIGEWMHLAIVLTPGRMTLWVNGELTGEGVYNAANPEDRDAWLGRVRKTRGMLHPPNAEAFGGEAPPFLLDDYVHFARTLAPKEVRALSRAGRGGIARADARLELLRKLRPQTIWVAAAAAGIALCGVFPRVSGVAAQLWRPAFASVWVILLAGGGVTVGTTVGLARAADKADREKLDLFAEQLRQAGETSFERKADLLRRARDYLRANPDVTQAELQAWAHENGAVHDHTGIDGIGWARVEGMGEDAGLPVRAYTRMAEADLAGWFWDGPRETLVNASDVAATGLVRLRPTASGGQAERMGVRLYLLVHDRPQGKGASDANLLGVAFLGVDLVPGAKSYWAKLPPIIGARFVPGLPHSRETVAVDTGDLYPATKRPARPYLEKEIAIRTYGRRIWVQLWTTASFRAHSGMRWPVVSGFLGSGFTLFAAAVVAVQTAGRLKQKRIAAELQESRDALRAAQKEREALSRELHDGAIQSLYAVQLQLGRIKQRSGVFDNAELAAAQAGLATLIGELREFTAAAPTAAIERKTLGQVFETIVAQAQLATPGTIELKADEGVAKRLNQSQAVHLANIAREALSNVVRHANAREVQIELRTGAAEEVVLEIRDNGRGINGDSSRAGHGLKNMWARAEELGGRFECESEQNQGTTIRIVLPLQRVENGEAS
jgi:signal transduction histidine kinase